MSVADEPGNDRKSRPRAVIAWLRRDNRRWMLLGLGVAVVAFVLFQSTRSDPEPVAATSITTTTTIPSVDLEIVVDSSVMPRVAEVIPLEEGGGPRPVGAVMDASGQISDIVLGEVVVFVPDQAGLDALEQLEGFAVAAIDDEDPEEGFEVLLQFDTGGAPSMEQLAFWLDTLDPGAHRRLTLSGDAVAATLGALAQLALEHRVEVSLNDVPAPTGIPDGTVREGYAPTPNAFDWPYVRSLANQEIGLDTAWQMLFHHDRQDNRVKVLVVDGGFQPGGDFPSNSIIRKGEWGPKDDWLCSGGNACPYHGTQVALTAAGRVDNEWGTAGSAGPFADLVAMPVQGGSWSTLRQLKRVVREERPDVINMSFGSVNNVHPGATRRRYDRTFRIIERRWGALTFASAGNEGIDVDSLGNLYLPCASTRVVCVGGMGVDTTERHDNSNYGTQADDRSVKIYGPYCTYVMADPGTIQNGAAAQGCGTSYASPFVAGVAALLRVADPSLSPGEMRDILYETAHVGGLGSFVTGHLRRVDAHMAVARALGVTWTQPTVTITEGGGTFPIDEVLAFDGTAHSYSGEELPIRWHSNIDGWLNDEPRIGSIGATLSVGEHLIQATAVDRRGMSGTASVIVEIVNEPPIVTIVVPQDGQTLYEGTGLNLIGYTLDPDPFINSKLAEEAVQWRIERPNGSVVWEADGHSVSTAIDAGDYVIRFTGTDPQGSSAEDVVSIEVLPLQDGWVPPQITILEPDDGTRVFVGGGTKTIDLHALAQGVDGNQISGQRFRWTAIADTGHEIVLCEGSNFPGSGGTGGGFVIPKSCKETTAEIGLAPGAVGRTVWAITLTAVDNQGVPVQESVSVEVVFATG